MLLNEISPTDPISQLALAGLEATCPILRDAQFFSRDGDSAMIKKAREAATPATIFRSLNENNVAAGFTNNYPVIGKKIVSFDAMADVALEDRNQDPETELANETRLKAREAGWILQDTFFNGDVGANAESFDGFKNLVVGAWDLSLASEGYTNGLVVPLGSSDGNVTQQQQFIEEILKLIERVRGGATHLYMPNLLRIRLVSVAKFLGYYRQTIDELGQTIDMIGDTILRSAGYNKDGSSVVPFNETVGSGTNCASIYGVRWGEGEDCSVLTSVGVRGRYAGQSGNLLTNNVNMDATILLQDDTSLVKQVGYRLS